MLNIHVRWFNSLYFLVDDHYINKIALEHKFTIMIKLTADKLLFTLLFITSILLVSQKSILNNVITITPKTHPQFELYDDNNKGGNTKQQVFESEVLYKWQCILDKGNTDYPYCGFLINLGKSISNGIDLSDHKSLKLWLKYQGKAKTIRVSLRNFNPDYSNIENNDSTKYHELNIPIEYLDRNEHIKLRNFNIPMWWKRDRQIPVHLGGPELSNTVYIDIQTGSDLTDGLHQFELKKIELHGQWLSTEKWYLSILFFWLILGATILIFRLVKLNKAIRQSNKRENTLIKQNTDLDIKAQTFAKLSKTDNLTGALNRQGIEESIERGVLAWESENKPLSIIMLDIDHFKNVNDTYGHDVGDKVLKLISKAIKKNIRYTDSFARWGGEEFVLVCCDTSIDDAGLIAENLRERITRTVLIDDIKVTASFGVSSVQCSDSVDDLFKRADEALYNAKNSGRNNVKIKD
ncbi:MAG: GGDEF domain-containing protein [Colwellia sp.]